MTVWIVILTAGVLTYLTRVTPLLATLVPTDPRLRRYLSDLPVSMIAALAGAAVIAPDQQLTLGPNLGVALVVVVVAAWTRNLLAAVLVGVALLATARSLTGG